jgi:hypothetical protein
MDRSKLNLNIFQKADVFLFVRRINEYESYVQWALKS